MNQVRAIFRIQLLFFALTGVSIAEDLGEKKSVFTFLNPTPPDLMRDFSTDRPDKTESAYTVDAGHFQHETDLINYTYDSESGERAESLLAVAPNLKLGLTNNIDIQLVVESFNYVRVKNRATGEKAKQSGFGDLTTRLKVNLWGNDGGDTAFALMPYMKFPTNRDDLGNNSVEGGLIAPLAIAVSDGLDMSLMTQIDVLRDDDESGHHAEFVNSVTFGHGFSDEVGAYAELWSSLSPERGPLLTADFGVTYQAFTDFQLDVGLNVGITDISDDLNPFLGFSQRF